MSERRRRGLTRRQLGEGATRKTTSRWLIVGAAVRVGLAASGARRWGRERAPRERPIFWRYGRLELLAMSPDVARIIQAAARRHATEELTGGLRRIANECEQVAAGLLPAPLFGVDGGRWLFDTVGAELASRVGETDYDAFRTATFRAARQYARALSPSPAGSSAPKGAVV